MVKLFLFCTVLFDIALLVVCQIRNRANNKESGNPLDVVHHMSYTKCNEYNDVVNNYCPFKHTALILGNVKAVPKEFPHMALLGYEDSGKDTIWFCRGSLISEEFILTTAWCLQYKHKNPVNVVRLGEYDLNATDDDDMPTDFTVTKRIPHPEYKYPSIHNDIGIIRLSKLIAFNHYIRPACLPAYYTDMELPKNGINSRYYEDEESTKLYKNVLSIFDHQDCFDAYNDTDPKNLANGISNSQFCVGSHAGDIESCEGIAGEPLQKYHRIHMCMYTILGINSFGKFCTEDEITPSIYTKVEPYLPWIESIVWPFSQQHASSTELTTPKKQTSIRKPAIQTCRPSITTVKGETVCQNTLIFEENFADHKLTRVWQHDVKMPLDTEGAEFLSYQNIPNICSVRDGNFNIFPKLLSETPGFSTDSTRTGMLDFNDRCTAEVDTRSQCKRIAKYFTILPPVVSCRITTKKSFTFKYGKVEIRAKLPQGDWLFPQLNLEPAVNFYGVSGYASGLLRVAFIRGNENLKKKGGESIDGRYLSGGAILNNREQFRDIWLKSTFRDNHFGEDFHVYELLWTNQTITLIVDGDTYGTIDGGFREQASTNDVVLSSKLYSGEYMAPFDKEFFLSLGVGVGGHIDFPDLSKNGFGNVDKPWQNTNPKAELQFWKNLKDWKKTWDNTNGGLEVDYIKVWSI